MGPGKSGKEKGGGVSERSLPEPYQATYLNMGVMPWCLHFDWMLVFQHGCSAEASRWTGFCWTDRRTASGPVPAEPAHFSVRCTGPKNVCLMLHTIQLALEFCSTKNMPSLFMHTASKSQAKRQKQEKSGNKLFSAFKASRIMEVVTSNQQVFITLAAWKQFSEDVFAAMSRSVMSRLPTSTSHLILQQAMDF